MALKLTQLTAGGNLAVTDLLYGVFDPAGTPLSRKITRLELFAQDLTPTSDVVFKGLNVTDMTLGSVLFAGTAGLVSQDNTNFFWDNAANELGLGTNAPSTTLHVVSASPGLNSFGNATIITSDNQAIDLGAQLTLGGSYTDAGAKSYFSGITGKKENGTTTNIAGYLQLLTTNAAGTLQERVRVTSTGNTGLGTPSPLSKLDVNGGAVFGTGYAGITAAPTNGIFVEGSSAFGIAAVTSARVTVSGVSTVFDQTGTLLVKTPNPGSGGAPRLAFGIKNDANAMAYSYIQSIESGVAVRSLLLQDVGGAVGIGILVTPASILDVNGNVSIGSGVAGITAAPSNGVLVQGQSIFLESVGLGSPNATVNNWTCLHIVGNGSGPSAVDSTQGINISGSLGNNFIGESFGVNVGVDFNSTTGVTNVYGLSTSNTLSGTFTNYFGLRAGSNNVTGTVTNLYGLYVDSQSGATNNFGAYIADSVGLGTLTPASSLHVEANPAATPDDAKAAALVNSTAATVGAQKFSPSLRYEGQGWKTDATAASQSVEMRSYLIPIQGAGAPTSRLVWESSINGGAYSELMTLLSNGWMGLGKSVPSRPLDIVGGAGAIIGASDGTAELAIFVSAGSGQPTAIGSVTSHSFGLFTNNGTNTLTVTTGSLVGIGLTEPLSKLDVNGGAVFGTGYAGITAAPTNGILVEGLAGFGKTVPASLVHLYQDSTDVTDGAGLTIEQDGTGDAIVQYVLTGATRWVTGIDNSVSDNFVFSASSDLSASPLISITTGGNFGVATTAPNSTIENGGSQAYALVAKTADYTATAVDHHIICDATSGLLTIALPALSGITGREYFVKRINSSGSNVVLDPNGSEEIDGVTTVTLTAEDQTIRIIAGASTWHISGQSV